VTLVYPITPARALSQDLLPPPQTSTIATDKIDQDILKRRQLLKWHQGLGIGMITLQAATVALGQLNYDDVISGKGTQKYQSAHRTLAISTATFFAVSALFAYLAPTPFTKKARLDTVNIHKWSMGLAALGMVAQIILGVTARSNRGSLDEERFAKAHLALGYGTLGLTTLGTSVLFF